MQPGVPFHLRVESGPGVGRRFPIVGIRVTIGRHNGNAIVIEDERLARRHAQFDLGPGGLSVTDLGSANGTRVNGQPVVGLHRLRPGDALDLGGVVLRVEGATPPAATVAAVAVPSPTPTPPDLAAAPAFVAGATASRPRSSARPLLIIGVVLAVLLICGCGVLVGILVLANRDVGGGAAVLSGSGLL